MRARRRGRLIRFWDGQAHKTVGESWFASSRAWVCGRAAGRTLEVCTGNGPNLAHYPRGLALTAVDWSPAMVEAAAVRARRLGIHARFQVADAAHLPFPDASFDTVVCTFALCCVPDERATLHEMSRVLKAGGALLLANNVASGNPLVRLVEHVYEAFTIPLEGHHQTRRPRVAVEALGFEIVASGREKAGMIERLHAIKPMRATQSRPWAGPSA